MDQNFIEEFKSLFEDEGMAYYYHMTEEGNGESICEEGLFLAQNDILTTAIPLTNEMINNASEFLQEESDHNITKRSEMVLIGCPKEEVDNLINESEDYESGDLDYIIFKDHIIGYIDMINQEIIYSDYYGYSITK